MIREVAQIGNPILRKTVPEITDNSILEQLKIDLSDTLNNQDLGVAIAAPQIFEEYRAFFLNIAPTKARPDIKTFGPLILVNPVIKKEFGSKKKMYEGCLSIPGMFAEVERREKVLIKYSDLEGKEHEEEYGGFVARVLLHEHDHLNGILFTDLMDNSTLMSAEEYIEKRKNKK